VPIPSSNSVPLLRSHATNATSTSFAVRADTVTEPTGDGVIDIRQAVETPTWIMLMPYGTGDADDVFDVRVIGWRKSGGAWTATRLVQFTATLGTKTGIAGGLVGASELYADTITAGSIGAENVSYRISSPVDNASAYVFLDTCGCQKIEILFDATTGSPTGMNCLYAQV
jgi:hypothetical protein